MQDEQQSETKSKPGPKPRVLKETQDVNPEVWKLIGRKTEDGMTAITEAMKLGAGPYDGTLVKVTVTSDGFVATTCCFVPNKTVKEIRDKAGNITGHVLTGSN